METKKILVVDDALDLELMLNQKFKKQIASGEYKMTYSPHASHALDLILGGNNFDLILLDLNYGNYGIAPSISGLMFLSKLNSIGISHKTIVTSAYLDIKGIRESMNNGAFDFISKPIDFSDLESTMNRAFQSKKTQVDIIMNALFFPSDIAIDYEIKITPSKLRGVLEKLIK